jgi:hypothetical protein
MAKFNLKFVKLLLVALQLHFAVVFLGTLALGHDDDLVWRTTDRSNAAISSITSVMPISPKYAVRRPMSSI